LCLIISKITGPSVCGIQLVANSSQIRNYSSMLNCLAFSPDGKQVVWGCMDGVIGLWDPTSGQTTVWPLTCHTGTVTSVAFSPDAQQIVSSSEDKPLIFAFGMQRVAKLSDHPSGSTTARCLLPGWLVSRSIDSTVWDVERGQVVESLLNGHVHLDNTHHFPPKWQQNRANITVPGSDIVLRVPITNSAYIKNHQKKSRISLLRVTMGGSAIWNGFCFIISQHTTCPCT